MISKPAQLISNHLSPTLSKRLPNFPAHFDKRKPQRNRDNFILRRRRVVGFLFSFFRFVWSLESGIWDSTAFAERSHITIIENNGVRYVFVSRHCRDLVPFLSRFCPVSVLRELHSWPFHSFL